MPGTLFVVATPIGNLEDLTFRAKRTLGEVDLIAAEDTRRTAKLLARYDIRRPLTSLHEHNEIRETPALVRRLLAGERIALVSDAGTPGIADPGSRLVAAARKAGVPVTPIPGPSAVVAALSVSGFPADQFVFMGFPPRSGAAREEWMATLAAERRTSVFLEAPHRITRTLHDLRQYLVERPISINREITKINEISVVSPISSIQAEALKELGEFTVVVSASSELEPRSGLDVSEAERLFGSLTKISGVDQSMAIDFVAKLLNADPRRVRSALKKAGIAAKRRGASAP